MSNALLVCWRNKAFRTSLYNNFSAEGLFEHLERWVLPGDVQTEPPIILNDSAMIAGVLNPKKTIEVRGSCFCLGSVDKSQAWEEFAATEIDGSYAIFRASSAAIELAADAVASRTIWYYFDDTLLIAATSQTAISFVLGSFQENDAILPWMISNGTLGPGDTGWDRRICRILPGTTVNLNRKTWSIRKKEEVLPFRPSVKPKEEHKRDLKSSIRASIGGAGFSPHHWKLLLSGGYDSRAISLLIPDVEKYSSICWGLSSSRDLPFSDASIADRLSSELGTNHTYFELDTIGRLPERAQDVELLISTFLTCGDGRSDNISGYIDNFAVWRALSNIDTQGVIRGDEGFGSVSLMTESQVRLRIGAALWSDYSNTAYMRSFEFFHSQEMPCELRRCSEETLDTWRDRLYHFYRIPVALASLNELKAAFVEIANPLLSRSVVSVTRELPDNLRTEKALFREVVDELQPKLAFARHESTLTLDNALRLPAVVEYMTEILSPKSDASVLPLNFLAEVRSKMFSENLMVSKRRNSARSVLRSILPPNVKNFLQRSLIGTQLDGNIVAFRCALVILMHKRLREAASAGSLHLKRFGGSSSE